VTVWLLPPAWTVGAVYVAVREFGGLETIVPLLAPPTTFQLTAWFVVPVTLAVNSCVPSETTVAVVGSKLTLTTGGVTVTAELPLAVVPCNCAVMVTVPLAGALGGAV
jgi:hypothetical protein